MPAAKRVFTWPGTGSLQNTTRASRSIALLHAWCNLHEINVLIGGAMRTSEPQGAPMPRGLDRKR